MLQEARKTVTAGAAFRPFPGDDWQASGALAPQYLFLAHRCHAAAAILQHHIHFSLALDLCGMIISAAA